MQSDFTGTYGLEDRDDDNDVYEDKKDHDLANGGNDQDNDNEDDSDNDEKDKDLDGDSDGNQNNEENGDDESIKLKKLLVLSMYKFLK